VFINADSLKFVLCLSLSHSFSVFVLLPFSILDVGVSNGESISISNITGL